MPKIHKYKVSVKWTGNLGKGTSTYQGYSRSHEITGHQKQHPIKGSSDPSFLGDASCFNPEELFVSTVSSCHMLWYLHLCMDHGIVIEHYEDRPIGEMIENVDASGRISHIQLRPEIQISKGSIDLAISLHEQAHKMCFIANSIHSEVNVSASISYV